MASPKKKPGYKLRDIVIPDNGSNYVPIPLESIPDNTILPMPIYLRVAGSFVCFRAKGDNLTVQRKELLRVRSIDSVYLTKADWVTYLTGLETEIGKLGPQANYTAKGVIRIRHLLAAYGKQLESGKEVNRATFEKIRDMASQIAVALRTNPDNAQSLIRHYDDPLAYPANHMVNVCVYGVAVGIKLNLDQKDLNELALACFLHDIGKLFIKRELLTKTSILTCEEQEEVNSHTDHGNHLLTAMYPSLPQVALTAKQHHERADGSGFPDNLDRTEIHLFARICKIADVFDFLTSVNTSVAIPLAPIAAIEAMKNTKGKFDKQLFATFSDVGLDKKGLGSLLLLNTPQIGAKKRRME